MGGFGPAGRGLPQQVAVHAGAQDGVQLDPQGKAERFAVKRGRGLEEFCQLENLRSFLMKKKKIQ